MNYISQNVRCLREKKNLSIRGLSKLSGVPHTVICRIEKGLTTDPSIETIMKLHTALDIDMTFLVYKDLSNPKVHSLLWFEEFRKSLYQINQFSEIFTKDICFNDPIDPELKITLNCFRTNKRIADPTQTYSNNKKSNDNKSNSLY